MIEDSPIVKDIRAVRTVISQQFHHDIDAYVDYLLAQSIAKDTEQEREVREEASLKEMEMA